MIGEIIFLLIVLVVVLSIMASRPRSILQTVESNSAPASKPQRNAGPRVRFSPEKKERTYSVKTGEILGESIVPVEDQNS